jgi:hypothetical protein
MSMTRDELTAHLAGAHGGQAASTVKAATALHDRLHSGAADLTGDEQAHAATHVHGAAGTEDEEAQAGARNHPPNRT